MKNSVAISILAGALALSSVALIGDSAIRSAMGEEEAATLERCDGYKLRFKANENANKYVVHDATDYRDGLELFNSDQDENGYIYYETETVGVHNITVDTYVDGASYSSNPLTITNKPMLFYGTPNCVKFYNVNTGAKTNSSGDYEYSVLQNDGSFLICTQQDFNTTYNKNIGNAVDFSDAAHVDKVISDIKNTGANVLFLGHRLQDVETNLSYWWFKSFEDSVVKRFMDAAWKVGMKCIITDNDIINHCNEGNTTLIQERLSNPELRKALLHPAFLGLQFKDEPASSEVVGASTNEVAGAGTSVKAIFDYWQNDNELKHRSLPLIFTSLRSYDENKSTEFGYFKDKNAYKDYIKSWITETGLDYFTFDTYTYTTRYYGVKSSWGSKYYYDPSKVIYEAISEAKSELKSELGKDIKVYQTITSGVDTSRKTETHYYDVFSSTFLAASQDVSGYALFEYSETENAKSTPLSLDDKFNNTYFYIQKANKQYRQIQSLLEGYKMTSNSISINGNYSSNSLYGRGVRTSTSVFTNQSDNSKTYQFITNFESDATNSTYKVTIPNGQIYYLFGYNQDTYQRVGTGDSVSLNNGEAILISNQTVDNVGDATFDKSRLDDFDVITVRDLMGKESVKKADGFGNTTDINTDFIRYPIVNSSNGSVAFRFNYRCSRLGSDWDDGLVDVYINNVWTAGHGYSIGCNSGGVHLKDANIIVNNILKPNEDNIVEVGAIKIKNTSQTYTYIKVNDALINEAVINTKSSYPVVQAYSSLDINEDEDLGVTLTSVDLHRKGSGLLHNLSGNASNINFSATNNDAIPYQFKDGTSLTFVSTSNNTLTKTGYNSYSLNLSEAATPHQRHDLKDYFYCYHNNRKYYFEISENHLYFTGSSWLSIGDLDQVSSAMLLSYTFQFSGSAIKNDQFKMKFMIDDSYSEQLNQLGEYGICVSTSSKTEYYPYASTHEDDANHRYVIIDLGAAITDNHQDDVFTVRAYLNVGGEVVLSDRSSSGSIRSIVTELYENESTRQSVENLYRYLAG